MENLNKKWADLRWIQGFNNQFVTYYTRFEKIDITLFRNPLDNFVLKLIFNDCEKKCNLNGRDLESAKYESFKIVKNYLKHQKTLESTKYCV